MTRDQSPVEAPVKGDKPEPAGKSVKVGLSSCWGDHRGRLVAVS